MNLVRANSILSLLKVQARADLGRPKACVQLKQSVLIPRCASVLRFTIFPRA